ncbi:MAG: hypothetical protein KDB22_06730 [Planctomycetales bacterium]|nr:hypothetical protein [Planctomycetales bacterium]
MVSSSRWLVLLMTSVMLSQSGCITLSALMGQKRTSGLDTSLLEAQGYSIPPGGMPSPVAADASRGPRVVLEVRGDGKHLESIPLPTDRAIFIEDLVQQANLHEQLGKLSISIMRPNDHGGPPLRMDTRTDDKGRAINVGQNYALLPGDHIIAYHDERTLLEKFIDKQLN